MKIMCDMLAIWPCFSHAKHRYIKNRSPDPLVILACILAAAFGFGIKIMAKVSNVSYHHLRDVYTDFIYAENMTVCNDIASNYIHSLPITRVWDLEEGVIIGDADGQKFETSRHTLQSRYSSKYFGTYKGISVYTLVVNNIPVNAKIIGPNEHESHHLYDIIYNNQSNVTVEKVTGDNHSINQINFVILDAINVAFIPGIKDIPSEAEKLYCVGDPSQYTGLIQPKGQIDTELIKSEKRGIIRVLLSLILQKNTQAVIVKKLSSHKRYSRLRNALWEYSKILKSTHVLNVIDNIQLRQTIQSGRNRTESYHQLHRTIRKIYSGAFRGRRKVDNAISNHASRFVANLIIAYNAMLLNSVYLKLKETLGEEMANRIVARISPMTWEHIIFTGRYHFKNHRAINFDELVDYLAQTILKTR